MLLFFFFLFLWFLLDILAKYYLLTWASYLSLLDKETKTHKQISRFEEINETHFPPKEDLVIKHETSHWLFETANFSRFKNVRSRSICAWSTRMDDQQSSREMKVIKAVGAISSKSENIKLLYLKGRVHRVHPS